MKEGREEEIKMEERRKRGEDKDGGKKEERKVKRK